MALSLSFWANYTANKVKMQRKSEDAVESNHVLRFVYDREIKHVEAVIQASMKDRSYSVKIDLNDSYGVSSSRCECPLGQFECHHVAAALLYGYKNVSKTDVKCSWLKKPKSAPPKNIQSLSQLYPLKENYSALGRPVNDDDRTFMYQELSKLGRFTALHWILSPEVDSPSLPVKIVEDVLVSPEYQAADDKMGHLRHELAVSPEQISEVAKQTVGQRNNTLWNMVRKNRLTASNFGMVLQSCKTKRFTNSLKKRLLSSYNLEAVRSIAWGINNEDRAIKDYMDLGAVVEQTGIWLHPCGVLGASPDGIVIQPPSTQVHCQVGTHPDMEPTIIEVKCPYSARDLTVSEAVASVKDFYIESNKGSFFLKPVHHYYAQIQGQLHIMGKECCDLIVWTTKDLQIIRIARDDAWTSNMQKLMDFYFDKFIPMIL